MPTQTGGSWRDGDGGGNRGRDFPDLYWVGHPKFGRKVRAWFYRSLYNTLQERVEKKWGPDFAPTDDELDRVCVWYIEREADDVVCVRWVDTEQYCGGRFAAGHYEIDWDAVLREWGRYRVVAKYPTLDAWLEAERSGQLEVSGYAGPSGADLLPVDDAVRLIDSAHARRRRAPRRCVVCGESFERPPGKGRWRRCPKHRTASASA